jgi:riboflavin kinase/FMN adenylyltransferase
LSVREQLRRDATPGDHALTIGVFDGVHRGHQMLIRRMQSEAAERGLTGGVITFHPSPVTVLRPDVPFVYLDSLERRVQQLNDLHVAFVSVLEFTRELSQVTAEDFVTMLVEETRMRLLVVGEDFALGKGREGTVARLTELGAAHGFEVVGVPLLTGGESDSVTPPTSPAVSSTRIRRALAAGEMEEVAELLTRPFSLSGPVLHGEERGRTIGFPTANLGVSVNRALPPNGVYVTRAILEDGRTFEAATNIGTNPTFVDGDERHVEAYLLDFEGDLYGQWVTIELLHRLRDELRYEGVDALVAQIRRDVDATRAHFARLIAVAGGDA